jgi:hypothetical protein
MLRAAEQYGVRDKFLDLFTFDVTQNPLRRGGWVDSIVTDPPCKHAILTLLTSRRCEGWSQAIGQESHEEDANARWAMFDAGWDILPRVSRPLNRVRHDLCLETQITLHAARTRWPT